MRDMQGSAAQKLALFEKLKAAGGFDGDGDEVSERPSDLAGAQRAEGQE
jgi:hypothetical protein